MPGSLPVPSKGALRHLRNLALGTSCTVAFTTGVLTEDRRRRIHSAREVYENGQKIRSSRSYHSSGRETIQTLESNVKEYGEDAYWLPSVVARLSKQSVGGWMESSESSEKSSGQANSNTRVEPSRLPTKRRKQGKTIDSFSDSEYLQESNLKSELAPTISQSNVAWEHISGPQSTRELPTETISVSTSMAKTMRRQPALKERFTAQQAPAVASDSFSAASAIYTRSAQLKPWTHSMETAAALREEYGEDFVKYNASQDYQEALACDVERLLACDGVSADLDSAAARFFEAFKKGVTVGDEGLSTPLLEAALKLSRLALDQSNHEIPEKVLVIVSRHGSIDKEIYDKFTPTDVVQGLVDRALRLKPKLAKTKIRDAASVYLTSFKDPQSTQSSKEMNSLGHSLCMMACNAGLHDLCLDVWHRLKAQWGKQPLPAVNHLITSASEMERDEEVIDLFKTFFMHSRPAQTDLSKIGDLVLKSVLIKKKNVEEAVEVLEALSKMAESQHLKMHTTALLQVLGHQWRSTRNIISTQNVFDRLSPMLPYVNHPIGLYRAMIQCCIDANEEALAQSYYDILAETYPNASCDVRTLGNFALAKARKHDWAGVQADLDGLLRNRQDTATRFDADFGAIFTPILRLFAQEHSIDRTELFLEAFVADGQVAITTGIFTIMTNMYCKAREPESMLRWIMNAEAMGCEVNTEILHHIITNYSRVWNYSFQEIFHLFRQFVKMSNISDIAATNSKTALALHHIARLEENKSKLSHVNAQQVNSVSTNGKAGPVYSELVRAYIGQNYQRVLDLYRIADTVDIDNERSLTLAVKASLKVNNGDPASAARLILAARKSGGRINASTSILILNQLDNLKKSGAPSKAIVQEARTSMMRVQKLGMEISPIIVTHTLSALVSRCQFTEALEAWEVLRHSLPDIKQALDLVTLTILFKAYVGIRSIVGIKWIMKTLIDTDIFPDKRFYLTLKTARKDASKISYVLYDEQLKGQQLLETMEKACAQVLQMRSQRLKQKNHLFTKTLEVVGKAVEDRKRQTLLPSDAGGVTSRSSGVNRIGERYGSCPQPKQGRAVAIEFG